MIITIYILFNLIRLIVKKENMIQMKEWLFIGTMCWAFQEDMNIALKCLASSAMEKKFIVLSKLIQRTVKFKLQIIIDAL